MVGAVRAPSGAPTTRRAELMGGNWVRERRIEMEAAGAAAASWVFTTTRSGVGEVAGFDVHEQGPELVGFVILGGVRRFFEPHQLFTRCGQ